MKDNDKVIYTVCTIENIGQYTLFYTSKELKEGIKTLTVKEIYDILHRQQHTRTVGFYHDINEAIMCVEENACDIYEGSYKHAVIEVSGPGLYSSGVFIDQEIWFEWQGDWESGGYVRIDKPECVKNIVGFGIG